MADEDKHDLALNCVVDVHGIDARAEREAEAIRLQEIAELVGRLEGLEFKITMKSDPNGNLYGSVNSAKIVELAAEQGVTLVEKDIRLESPIKTVGQHMVKVHVKDDEFGEVLVDVEAEGKTQEALDAEAAAEAALDAEASAEGPSGPPSED